MKRKWLPLGALLALTTTAISSTAYAGIHSVNLGEPFSIQLNECGTDRYQLAIPPDGVTLTSSGLLSGTTLEPGAVRLDLKCVRANDTVYSASTTYLSANMPSTSNVNFQISGADTQTATIDLADYHSPLLASFEIDANNKPKNGTASISGTVLTYTRSGNWAEDTFRIQGIYVSPTGVTQRGNFGTVTVSMDVNKPESRDITIDASATSGSFLIDMATHFPGIASAGPLSQPSQGFVTRVTNTGMRYDPPAGGVSGSVSFQFTLRDVYGNNSDPKTVTLNFDPVEITLPSMSLDAPVGGAVSQKLTASGGTAPYTYKVTSGALPDGLTISGDEIVGTPTVEGIFSFDVMATDANGATGTRSYSMVVKAVKANVANDAVVAVTSSGAVFTYAYDFWQHVTDGDVFADQLNIKSISDSRVTIGEGSRPRPSYLYIPRAVRGDLDVQYSVTDVNGVESNTATIRFQITGDEMRLVVDESSTPEIGKMYGVSFIADLGTAPFSYTVSGTIPDGLKWEEDHNAGDSANFTLRGIPTAKGVYPISVTVTDSTGQSKTISHTIDLGEREVPTATDKTIKMPYGGSIDVDLSDLAGGDWTSVGVYSATGSYTLNGNVVSYRGPGKSDPFEPVGLLSYFVKDDVTGLVGDGTLTFEFEAPLAPTAQSFAVQGDSRNAIEIDLAPHVSAGFFDLGGTAIQDMPSKGNLIQISEYRYRYTYDPAGNTAAEKITFTYQAYDVHTQAYSELATVAIDIPALGEVVLPDLAMKTKVGEAISQMIEATGGDAPYSYRLVAGTLPAGLVLNGNSIEGTPTEEGTFNVTVEATDANNVVGSKAYDIVVDTVDVVEVTLPALTLEGKVGDAFTQDFVATGGAEPYIYELVSGALPKGLSFSGNKVSGTPTVEGTFSFDLKATDENGVIASQSYSMTVSPAEAVVEAPIATNGALEVDYGQAGSIDLGGLTTGVVDAIKLRNQPSKGTVTLDGNRATYRPNSGEIGTDQFTFTATNAAGTVTATVTITIKAPLGEVPVAKDHFVRLAPVQSGAVDLTTGSVSKDPIIVAHLISSVPASTGSAALAGTRLGFGPHKAFAGAATVSYQLENRWGRSNIAKVTFVVADRPDPSKDAEVAALIKTQKDAGAKLPFDQVDNITRRIEQIRGEAPGARQNSFDWQLGVDSKDTARYDHEGNEIAGQKSANARGSFTSENPLAGWTTGYIRLGETDFGSVDLKSTAVGGTAGLDYRFNDQFVGGVALGYGREATKIGEDGTENVAQAISGALYGTWHNQSGAFVDGILGFSHLTMDSSRYVTSTGDMANGSRTGSTIFGSIVGGYRFETENGLKFEPYAGFRGVVGKLNGFSETGADWNNLAYGDTDIRSLKAVAGIRLEKDYETEDFLITPSFKAEYRHELAGDTTTKLGYADLGTMPYSVITEASESNSVVASVGVRVRPKDSNLSVEAAAQANMSGSGKPTMTYSVRANYEFCGIGAKKTDCMSREEKVTYYRDQLAKAERKKDLKKVAEFRKLLAEAEAKLEDWKKFSATLTPVPDFNAQFVDTISGPKPAKSKVQKPKRAKKAN